MNHLTIPEIKKLLSEVNNDRHKTLILVTFCHGLRASEAIEMTREDIQGGHVRVQRLKGSKKTVQPYVVSDDPELDESRRLTELYNNSQPKEQLFNSTRIGFYKLMRRAGARAGLLLERCHPHALKHSTAMLAIKELPIHAVAQLLGHKSLNSTSAYLSISDKRACGMFAKAFTNADNHTDDEE
jgi:integrase